MSRRAAERRWFTPPADGRPYFAVVGHPVAHSKSPAIHAAFAAQTGRQLCYERIEVMPGSLDRAVAEFRDIGGSGLNVTVPLKEEACALALHREPRAAAAGAANTLWFLPDGRLAADNTDGPGLVRDLENNHGVVVTDQRVLVLGAGGAARGVIAALLACRPAELLISNRSAARARELAAGYAATGLVATLEWGAAPTAPAAIVINATSASLSGAVPLLADAAFRPDTVCYDMMYGSEPTAFLRWAQTRGVARRIDGLGMLVEQAAVAFAIWHGVLPQTADVIAALRNGNAAIN